MAPEEPNDLTDRRSPYAMSPAEFRRLGHLLVDQTADLLESIPDGRVTVKETPGETRSVLGEGPQPEIGEDPEKILLEAVSLLKDHSTFNGHPKFWGYITASPAPIGILGDLLASAANPNLGGWMLSPAASAIELQTVRWIGELISFPSTCGGLLVSGGNVANILALMSARVAALGQEVRATGLGSRRCAVYASSSTHTWIQKAADLAGLGTDSLRTIDCDESERMDFDQLVKCLERDLAEGVEPIAVVATSGTVSTGAIDPIQRIHALCKQHGIWLHIDGAYGAPAASLPEADPDLQAISKADSVALDPHKWLYSPLEAGCLLVKDQQSLLDAFSYRPPYYPKAENDEKKVDFFEIGIQNSRGFRALKVWMSLRQAGKTGSVESIRQDIALSKAMADLLDSESEIEVVSQRLSIVCFRFKPNGYTGTEEDLDSLNRAIIDEMHREGEAYVSHAVIDGRFYMRACIVNINTTLADVQVLPGIVCRLGRALSDRDASSRPGE